MLDINELIKSSIKSRDKVSIRAYKNLKSEIQLISKMCKKLEDAILDFSKAHRENLMPEYTSELRVLKSCSQSL